MRTLRVIGQVDEQHRLVAVVPTSIAVGRVEFTIEVPSIDEADPAWAEGVAREWTEELANPAEEIYTLDDGEPVDGPR